MKQISIYLSFIREKGRLTVVMVSMDITMQSKVLENIIQDLKWFPKKLIKDQGVFGKLVILIEMMHGNLMI